MLPNKRDRHKGLIEKITHRGPTAYRKFQNILNEFFPEAVEILTHVSYRSNSHNENHNNDHIITTPQIEIRNNNFNSIENTLNHTLLNEMEPRSHPSNAPQVTSSIKPFRGIKLIEFEDEVKPRIAINVIHSKEFHCGKSKISSYSMKSQHRGAFVLVNNINFEAKNGFSTDRRNGAEADKNNLVTLFRQMGFTIYLYEDLYREVCAFSLYCLTLKCVYGIICKCKAFNY